MNIHLIAKEQEIAASYTIVNFQGVKDLKYVVSFQFSAKPKRAKFAEGWPATPEENMERLVEAGIVMDSYVPKCRRCEEFGHESKDCEQPPEEEGAAPRGTVVITCANCQGEGHRARDCTEARKTFSSGCKNCGSEEHRVKEVSLVSLQASMVMILTFPLVPRATPRPRVQHLQRGWPHEPRVPNQASRCLPQLR